MSYGIKIRAHGGKVVAHEFYGDVPDGQFDISGHNADDWASLSVLRRTADNTYGEFAQHSSYKPGIQVYGSMLDVPEEEAAADESAE